MNAKTLPKVYISHGHDEEAITTVAKFVETLGFGISRFGLAIFYFSLLFEVP